MLRVIVIANGRRAACSGQYGLGQSNVLAGRTSFPLQSTTSKSFATSTRSDGDNGTPPKTYGRAYADQGKSFKASRPRKLPKDRFLARELKENPEFFKAFPHLQPPVYDLLNPEVQEQNKGQSLEYLDQVRSREIFDKEELRPSSAKRDGYFQTLLHQHNQYMPLGREEREEMIRENEINYVQAYQGPSGPLKYMSEEAKEKVHQELDLRMQEVEDTGLTRSEILHEQQTGVKLVDDPFFQFIKSSRTAREMLLKPGEEFTADRVIELALRQDVSPDDSLSMNKEDYRVRDWDSGEGPNWEYKKKYRDLTPLVEPHAYFAGHNVVERRKKLFEYDQERPATFINRPLSRQ